MMMTERQLKAVRAEKSDTSAIKKLQSDVKVLENKLQNKKDENSNLSREISDLKRYNLTIFNLLNRQGEIRVRVMVRVGVKVADVWPYMSDGHVRSLQPRIANT